MRRRGFNSPMEWARFCGVMMPTIRSPSMTGTSCAPCPPMMRRSVFTSESSGCASGRSASSRPARSRCHRSAALRRYSAARPRRPGCFRERPGRHPAAYGRTRCSASSSVSEAESVLNWVSITSRMSTGVDFGLQQQSLVLHMRAMRTKPPIMISHILRQTREAGDGDEAHADRICPNPVRCATALRSLAMAAANSPRKTRPPSSGKAGSRLTAPSRRLSQTRARSRCAGEIQGFSKRLTLGATVRIDRRATEARSRYWQSGLPRPCASASRSLRRARWHRVVAYADRPPVGSSRMLRRSSPNQAAQARVPLSRTITARKRSEPERKPSAPLTRPSRRS